MVLAEAYRRERLALGAPGSLVATAAQARYPLGAERP
jgi:hypothetical protein